MTHIIESIQYFIMNPIWVFALISLVLVGYVRVKRERSQFYTRIDKGLEEMKEGMFKGIGVGVLASILFIGIGILVSPLYLLFLTGTLLILLFFFNFIFLSSIYPLIVAFFGTFLFLQSNESIEIFGMTLDQSMSMNELAVSLLFIGAILLMGESILLLHLKKRSPSPYLKKTARGRYVGAFRMKQLWVVPLLFVIPGDWVDGLPYWPQLAYGETSFSFILFPYVIGFQRQWLSTYPNEGLQIERKRLIQLSLIAFILGVISLMYMDIAIYALAMVGLFAVIRSFVALMKERKDEAFVKPLNEGLPIVGVLPNSPAEQMGLKIGEVIRSVNQQIVYDEKGFYEAVQKNAAHCRLQVLGRNQEIRLEQTVLFEQDHFKLGLLFMTEKATSGK